MKKLFLSISLMVLAASSFASSGGMPLQSPNNDLGDQKSLQNGAKLFINYCLSCHEASYMRYSRMATDLNLSEEQVLNNMMFATDKIGSTMTVAMSSDDATRWFGVTPPDLSVVSRSRGTDWLYTYMLSFYKDDSRPWGVNNLLFKDVGMPHVFWELQGEQELVHSEVDDGHGGKHAVTTLKLVGEDDMSKDEIRMARNAYSRDVRDLVNYIEYMGEPAILVRYSLGVKVIAFLMFFLIFAYLLKKEYWKDIH
jgi:ubiquinol-cytochrome c reductase cytochrome c1 subunit